MKILHRLLSSVSRAATFAALGTALLATRNASANPFASCITVATNSTATNVTFYINESGGSVVVTYEDGSTNSSFNGITTGTNVASGPQTFSTGGHNGYTITCHKVGTGTPFQINSASGAYYYWPTPRGIDANKNPQIGAYFGRVYNGNATPGTAGSQIYRARGVTILTPDLSTNLSAGGGTNGSGSSVFYGGSSSSPYRITVGPDGTVYVADYSTANAAVYAFDPNFSKFTNVVIGPCGENQGYAAMTHGDQTGVCAVGSLANGSLVLYTFDPDLPLSFQAALWYVDPYGNDIYHTGSEGICLPNYFNNIYQYVITNSSPIPGLYSTNANGIVLPVISTNPPVKGVCLGLPSFQDSQIGDLTVEPNGYTIAEFNRANYSDGNIQVYDTNFNLIYTSLQPNGTDPFNANGYGEGYAGVRVSPDGQFLMTVNVDNQIEICFLTNGLPDVSSLRIIPTAMGSVGNSRGCCFDAAENIIQNSSGEAVLSAYSLGYTSTCVTSNDVTGTNGTFQLKLPPVTASLAIAQSQGSQNYISTGGTPIAASFTISLNTNYLSAPSLVNFTLSGNGTNGVNFVVNNGYNANGVFITNSYVVFPSGTYPGGGNWQVTITLTPTASPLSGPTFTETVIVGGGTNYILSEPVIGSLSILNTGPQQLLLGTATNYASMYRGTTNDYAEFIITRYGDISVGTYTVTNFNLGGTAVYGVDYTAGPQYYYPGFPPSSTPPNNGFPGIQIAPYQSVFTNVVGNPVPRANIYEPKTNLTIVIGLTNSVTGVTNTSLEGVAYTVSPGSVSVSELDNAVGGEVVIWSDPLTNALTSTNYTVTFDSSYLGTNTVLPVVIPNYTNTELSLDGVSTNSTNDFSVLFGNPVANDGIPTSPLMSALGWTNALRVSVENHIEAVAGVNVMPQGVIFHGNYALRFSMFLSLYDRALNNPFFDGVVDRQFALFGINMRGTNCDYRPTFAINPTTAAGATNWDGVWFATDAGCDSQTPADFDAFSSPSLPNSGGTDLVSNRTETQTGVFKDPPFAGIETLLKTFGGEPAEEWVDVSVETTIGTNVQVYINQTKVLSSFTNNPWYTNGTIMLGYENPLAEYSDGSAFAYFSNLRVVELSPYLSANPASGLIITNGQNASISATGTYASAPLTNIWYAGVSTPLSPYATNSANATNLTSTLSLSGLKTGTNFIPVFSDVAGSVTGAVSVVELITGPTNVTAAGGANVTLSAIASGQSAPTAYQWLFNGVAIPGATSASYTVTNASSLSAGLYSVAVTNAYGSVIPSATLTVGVPANPVVSGVTFSPTNMVIAVSSTDPNATASSFLLLSTTNLALPLSSWTTNSSAVVTGSSGAFSIKVPTTNAALFFIVKDKN